MRIESSAIRAGSSALYPTAEWSRSRQRAQIQTRVRPSSYPLRGSAYLIVRVPAPQLENRGKPGSLRRHVAASRRSGRTVECGDLFKLSLGAPLGAGDRAKT